MTKENPGATAPRAAGIGCVAAGPIQRQDLAVSGAPMAVKSTIETLVTVFGGSGFLGRHVVRALAHRGYRIRVAVRRPELTGHLRPMGKVGQIHAVQANLRFADSVAAALRDADAAVNLVGILFERGNQRFDAVQVAGAEAVAAAAKAAEIPRSEEHTSELQSHVN